MTKGLRGAYPGAATATIGSMATRGSILVVDDEPTIADVVSRYLERAGYSARVAADGPKTELLTSDRVSELFEVRAHVHRDRDRYWLTTGGP